MRVAAEALRAMGKRALADDITAMADEPGGPRAIGLAADLLAQGHTRLALGIALYGRAQGSGPALALDGIAAESLARLGRHRDALELLQGYIGRWPDPALLRRHVLSALMGQDERGLDVDRGGGDGDGHIVRVREEAGVGGEGVRGEHTDGTAHT